MVVVRGEVIGIVDGVSVVVVEVTDVGTVEGVEIFVVEGAGDEGSVEVLVRISGVVGTDGGVVENVDEKYGKPGVEVG